MGIITMKSTKTAWIGSLEWSCSGGSVTVTMYTGKTDGYPSSAPSGANFNATITVGSTTRSFSYQQQELDMYVGSVTVPVSGNTVQISGRVEAPYGVSMYGYPLTGSETVTLQTEPEVEASSFSLSADTVQMGKKLLITIDWDDPGCKHDLKIWIGGENELDIASNVGSSYSWTVPDLTAYWPNALEQECVVICITYFEGAYIGYTTQELTVTVPDPSVPVAEENLTMGLAAVVSCSRNSENFRLKLELEFHGITAVLGEGLQDSFTVTPDYSLAARIPDLTYGTGTLKCTTYHGTAVVGIREQTVRLTVPDNSETRPVFSPEGLTLTPVSSLPTAFAGVYMRGRTGIKAAFSASSPYSTLKAYEISVGSQSAAGNPAVIETLVNEGSVRVTAKVTDARGFFTTVTTTVQVLPYRNPKVTPYTGYSAVICERAKASGELSAEGTYLAIKAGRTFSSVVLDGQEQNRCVLRYRWKVNGAADYGSWTVLIPASSSQTEVSVLVSNVVTSLQSSYQVQIEAADTLGGTHTLTFQIMTEAVSFVLYDGPDGAGFGKYPEAPHVVDIASHMTLRVRGKLVVDGSDWQDLGLATGVSESIYPYGRKEVSGCHYQVADGNHVYLAVDCAFDHPGTAKVLNASPIPGEYRPKRTTYALCPVNGQAMALVSAGTDGYIRVQWVQKLTDTVSTGSCVVEWLDGYLDYWI